jgi:hypothetical protein
MKVTPDRGKTDGRADPPKLVPGEPARPGSIAAAKCSQDRHLLAPPRRPTPSRHPSVLSVCSCSTPFFPLPACPVESLSLDIDKLAANLLSTMLKNQQSQKHATAEESGLPPPRDLGLLPSSLADIPANKPAPRRDVSLCHDPFTALHSCRLEPPSPFSLLPPCSSMSGQTCRTR